ncbi:hypothetical protein [Lysobacter arvi]|uniref:DNA ligase (ATP) n=1 Tax=Lysobacter arvi TaxID=3038776 RepID=A0ABU1CEM8_9GAMM|nr:hypothetical protein [Lysobacter arvi]MDR0183234.1 hypothetical protein [Lysobacter arvi]
MAAAQGFEGMISKRAARPYVHGRGDDWRKTKVLHSDEVAWWATRRRKAAAPAAGRCSWPARRGAAGNTPGGTGFSGELIRSLKKHLQGGGPEPTFAGEIDGAFTRGLTWFEPRFVAEVFVRGYRTSGVLRQPSLKAVRPDKDPKDLRSSDRRKPRNAS